MCVDVKNTGFDLTETLVKDIKFKVEELGLKIEVIRKGIYGI